MNKLLVNWQWIVFGSTVLSIVMLFWGGWYKYLGATDSSTLTLENTLLTVRAHREANIIVLGDSTAAVEVRTNLLNQLLDQGKAINLGMPGSWFYSHYMMQELVKSNNPNADTVILLLGPDEFTNNGNARLYGDLEYHKTNISILDVPVVWELSDSNEARKTNLLAILYRPVLFKTDMQDLLLNPLRRITELPRNLVWLNRSITIDDPLWEDERTFDVCELGPLSKLEKNLAKATAEQNEAQSAKYKMNVAAYLGRQEVKVIGDNTERSLDFLLGELTHNFQEVYVINAPIFQDFGSVYPADYIAQVEELTRRLTGKYPNANYIPLSTSIKSDCSNFMDVVHLSRRGGEILTRELADYFNKRE